MSNSLTCPCCHRPISDASWPADGWGYMVTQHDIDRASGAEDPIVFVQRVGQRYALCACRRAVWISDLGFLVLADPAP